MLALSYWTSFRFPVLITRGSNTYGPNQYPEKFIPLFVTNALEDQPVPLYGDGRYRRDWLSVFDHCAAIDFVLRQGEPGTVYNIGGGNERENLAVAEMILRALGKPMSLIRYVQDRPGHDRRYAVDCTRLHTLGWRPAIQFEEGLRATVQWYRENQQSWRKIKSGEFRAYYETMYRQRLKEGTSYEAASGRHWHSPWFTRKYAKSGCSLSLNSTMRVLITGANGQLGHELQQVLAKRAPVLMSRPAFDLLSPEAERLIVDARPDIVFHAAAYTDVDGAEQEPALAMAVNAAGTERVARATCSTEHVRRSETPDTACLTRRTSPGPKGTASAPPVRCHCRGPGPRSSV